MSIAYFECVFVDLIIRRTKRVRRIFICDLSSCTTFLHIKS
jgi:hypothetical protein